MKERAILYSAPMVRARRAGLKTHTRRLVTDRDIVKTLRVLGTDPDGATTFESLYRCPYGLCGDRLWVREAWRTLAEHDHLPPRDVPKDAPIWYEADGPAPTGFGRYRHARFMCRWMSRGLDEITSVRVEQLHDINDDGAKAEGCPGGHGAIPGYGYNATPQEHFRHVWEEINGPGSWDLNPWVWVIEFRRVAA